MLRSHDLELGESDGNEDTTEKQRAVSCGEGTALTKEVQVMGDRACFITP